MLFVCLRGAEEDGHAYAPAAFAHGCRAFVCEYPLSLPEGAAVCYVPDSTAALASLASAFYGWPERDMVLIGITGTKGKTTTALMIRHLLQRHGIATGYIGSNGIQYAAVQEDSRNTTPDALTLRRHLAAMRGQGVRTVVMEVSSQALATGRVIGLQFPLAVYTNLAPDHIGAGEHPDLAHYRTTKARLFSDHGCHTMVVNSDDPHASFMIAGSSASRILTASLQGDATLTASHLRAVPMATAYATSCLLWEEDSKDAPVPLTLPLPGECNVQNALLALLTAQAYMQAYAPGQDARLRSLSLALEEVQVPGRFERVLLPGTEADFVIDYAHNGYSLRAAIRALRAYAPARLVCLFGSVGGRTYSRRTELAQAACAADFCIVTTDDPDTERPWDTMRELCRVLEENGRPYVAIPDRAEAIAYAVRHVQPGDLVLLAGKGHEKYQRIGGQRVAFSERALLQQYAATRV